MSTAIQTIRRHPKDGLHQTQRPWALQRRGKTMETYVEQYQSRHGGVTLHIWREREGQKEGNYLVG